MLGGRQIAWHIYRHFRLAKADGAILEFKDLLNVKLKGDNLMAFENDWDYVLGGLEKIPEEQVLESLYFCQIEQSAQLKTALQLYTDGIVHKGEEKSYEKLRTIVRAHLEHKRLKSNRDAMDGGKGYPGKGKGKGKGKRKGKRSKSAPGTKVAAGDCRQFLKTGSCSRGDSCPYVHDHAKANPSQILYPCKP